MKQKSHVGMGYTMCISCGKKFDEVVLLDRMFRESLDYENCMGNGFCEECRAMSDEYLTLIEATGDPSTDKKAMLTGEVVRIRWNLAEQMFGDEVDRSQPFGFIEAGGVAHIKNMFNFEEESEDGG